MKRNLGKIIALIVSVMLMVSVFASCELFSVNVDGDMEQVVANVQLEKDDASEAIYKRELVAGYVTYGYQYVMQYGYTESAAYELVLDNLIQNKVIVQYARKQLAESGKNKQTEMSAVIPGTDVKVESALSLPEADAESYIGKRVAYIESIIGFVTADQVAESAYNVRATLKSWVDSLDENVKNEASEKEDETYNARAIPTAKTVNGTALDKEYIEANPELKLVAEEELDGAQATAYSEWKNKKHISFKLDPAGTTARKAATKSFVDTFAQYGIIGTTEFEDLGNDQYDLKKYSYYVDLMVSSLESFIITNYEDHIRATAEKSITPDALWSEFEETYETQKAQYSSSLSAYETALDGVTEDSYILYNPDLGDLKYGYVANILIGFSDAATSALTAYKSSVTDRNKINEYREELLKTIVAKDQRTSWLQSGYYKNGTFGTDYVKSGNAKLTSFVGDFNDITIYKDVTTTYTYFKNEKGEWAWGDKSNEDYKANFIDIVADEITFEAFLNDYFSILGNTAAEVTADEKKESIYYKGTIGTVDEAKLDLIDDLLFAFNTDPGGLNNYLGYLYSPKTSATQYVPEFAEAAKRAVEGGVGSYYIVATDYGYHIIICTKVVEPSAKDVVYSNATADGYAAFEADLEDKSSVAYKFYKAKLDANIEKLISDVVTFNISKYVEDEIMDSYIDKDTIKNLISEEEEDEHDH